VWRPVVNCDVPGFTHVSGLVTGTGGALSIVAYIA
jgi:hypothetical protein